MANIYTANIDLDGETVLMILVPPDWAEPVVTTIGFRAEVSAAKTGLEHRRADAACPRFRQAYRTWLDDDDAQTIRACLGGLGEKRVAMPLWNDLYNTGSFPMGRVFLAQKSVGWDEGFANVTVAGSGANPGKTYNAPLVVGRWERPKVDADTDLVGDFEFVVDEDSPWACRITINQADPVNWDDTNWIPNWIGPQEESSIALIELDDIGRGREKAAIGDGENRWRQRARFNLNRAYARMLISFFSNRKGPVEAFAMPSFFSPGTETAQAPHDFDGTGGKGLCRFADGSIEIEWDGRDECSIELGFAQVFSTEGQERNAYAFLYEISVGDAAGEGDVLHLTDWEQTLAVDVGGGVVDWTPARVEHQRIKQTLLPQDEDCSLEILLDDAANIEPLSRAEVELPVHLRIWEYDIVVAAARSLFVGRVQTCSVKGNRLSVKAARFGGVLKRTLPRFQTTRTCNFTLFDDGCKRRNPTVMLPDVWKANGEFSSQSGFVLTLTAVSIPSGKPGHPAAAHYYAGGWLDTGTGNKRQLRAVLESTASTGTPITITLALHRPIREDLLEEGQKLYFYPGCSGEYSECKAKFANGDSFGGFPFIPSFIETQPSGASVSGKG